MPRHRKLSLEEIDLLVREGLQFGTLLFSLVLIKISLTIPEGFDIESFHGTLFVFISFFSVIYFATSVLAVALILWDAMKIEVEYITRYLIVVIIVGVLVGSGLMLVSNYWTSFF
ncbi:MAG: hypothetical protein ONB05_02285 [candidate division KSB1 bacterium]|nr:hypothetical protein [candidate division KSB1 bacterium]